MIEAQQPLSLTPEAYQVAAAYQLGMPTVEYGPSRLTKIKVIALAFWFVITVGLTVLCVIYSQFSLSLLMAACAIVVPLIVLGDKFLSRDKRVYVCPGGLLYLHGGKTDAIRWDQVEAVWQRITRRTSYGIQVAIIHLYTLRRNDGAKFKFDDHLGNVEALGNTIVSETSHMLWPRYIAAYQAGQTLNFGQISLNQQGVSNGKELLPWPQVQEIKVNRGFISIQKEGNHRLPWKSVAASQIPNANVFMALVNSIVSGGQK